MYTKEMDLVDAVLDTLQEMRMSKAELAYVSRGYWMDNFCTDGYSPAGRIFKDNVWNRTCGSCGF